VLQIRQNDGQATDMARQMHLGLFLYPTGHHIAAWRHPESVPDAGINLQHVIDLCRQAEAAKFDLVFLADSNTVGADDPAALFRISTRYLCQFEPVTLLGAIAAQTTSIGMVSTVTTTYTDPFSVARRFATLDHMSAGRAGWNVVTSADEREAGNFGVSRHMDRDLRYDRAGEFVEVVRGLWDSWEDDAFLRDRDSGVFFDPAKLHVLNHQGRHFSVRGPLNIARPPQGWPVVVQAGASEPGRDLSARIAEVVFAAPQGGIAAQRAYYADVKSRLARYGRDPDQMKIMLGLFPVVGRTRDEADALYAQLMELVHPEVVRQNLSQILGLDVSAHDIDGPPPLDLPPTNGMQAKRDMLVERLRSPGMTLRKLYQELAGARGHWMVRGTATDVADAMQDYFEAETADGFLVMPPWFGAPLRNVTEGVIPELQRRGLFRTDYAGRTLRAHLGLKRPAHPASAAAEVAG